MLNIRRAQMATMAEHLLLDRLAAHLLQYFPSQAASLGPDGLRRHLSVLLERLRPHGLCEEAIYKYASLTIVHGLDFETRRETAWMAGYLHDPEVPDMNDRIRRLYSAAVARAAREERNRTAREIFNAR